MSNTENLQCKPSAFASELQNPNPQATGQKSLFLLKSLKSKIYSDAQGTVYIISACKIKNLFHAFNITAQR